jgi:alginate O-acetyltransferase complex protein AlgI
MLFNSLTFLVFFVLVYTLYLSIKDKKYRVYLITIASYIFYGFWNSPFVLLLLISTVVDFNVGKRLFLTQDRNKRKFLLIASLAVNLGMLFFFKYYNLFAETGISILNLAGIDWHPPLINVILPVGISFYTFQTLSYTIDIYYKKIEPESSIWKFAAFVSFFPQLVAGPILRAKEFLPQFNKNRTFSWEIFYQGFFLIIFGLFKKMVIADNLAPFVERVYDNNFITSFSDAWVSTLAFTFQIYMDFSGYSDIAIGLSLLLGFYIPDNFNSPYAAISFSDFWRRWHISLSSWLRDYLYIPLGGNKKSNLRTNINLMITMLLGGLWHGAAWNFVVWGFMHGIYLFVERVLGLNKFKTTSSIINYFRKIIVFILVMFTWVMFRADFARAIEIFSSMLGFQKEGAIYLLSSENVIMITSLSLIILMFQYYFANKRIIDVFTKFKYRKTIYILIVSILIFFIITFKGEGGAFIYFQF